MQTVPAAASASMGIQSNLRTLDEAATRIAKQPLGSNLIGDFSQMKMAQHGIAANAAVLRVSDEMLGVLVDTLA